MFRLNYLPQTSRPNPEEDPEPQDRGSFVMGAAEGWAVGLILGGAAWLVMSLAQLW